MGRYTPPKKKVPFERAELRDMNERCGPTNEKKMVRGERCPVCNAMVILHCFNCKVQISGCQCTLAAKVIKENEERRRRLWTPGQT